MSRNDEELILSLRLDFTKEKGGNKKLTFEYKFFYLSLVEE